MLDGRKRIFKMVFQLKRVTLGTDQGHVTYSLEGQNNKHQGQEAGVA